MGLARHETRLVNNQDLAVCTLVIAITCLIGGLAWSPVKYLACSLFDTVSHRKSRSNIVMYKIMMSGYYACLDLSYANSLRWCALESSTILYLRCLNITVFKSSMIKYEIEALRTGIA